MRQYMCASTQSTTFFVGCQDIAKHSDVHQRKVGTHTPTFVYCKFGNFRVIFIFAIFRFPNYSRSFKFASKHLCGRSFPWV